jgi:membrane-associated phospholipid phosphatase
MCLPHLAPRWGRCFTTGCLAARFAGLTAALEQSGIAGSQIGGVQSYLWGNFVAPESAVSAAISAFPSVHVAMATLTMLYLAKRLCWLVLPGLCFLTAIGFLSVYTGYHYAIDGYVSVMVVMTSWVLLRYGAQLRPWRMPRTPRTRAIESF